ncbi:MAG: hypothetical protein A2024_05260 [Candidatus Edwardsbacteria bacterium GWF2_54_11]|uniref:Glycosyltransferase 2-like domain-containing protein n=1 Tax=Candidatus Edwardsbacteria bacterium GWF2_54_11 TaxID=1817851 RepID=A0A1F5RGE4_9BACT|nr:MAG: hypothetical protein A2024_05260 [Candidatus Edwardsbacteria bacterium GWF2_54_11]
MIDGNSVDNTKEVAGNCLKNNLLAKNLKHWEIIDNPHKTAPYGMNIGINKAKGDYILILSGHSLIAPDYLTQCIKTIKDKDADNVGGPAIPIDLKNDSIARAISMAHLSPFGLGGGAFRLGDFEGYVDTVYLGFYKKETFARYGLYDARLTRNQDIELNSRIRRGIKFISNFKFQNSEIERESNLGVSAALCEEKEPGFPIGSGMTGGCGIKSEKTEKESNLRKSAQSADREAPGKIYLTPKIKSYYYCRNTLSGLWSQNFKNGQWVVYTKYIAPYALSLRHFIPLIFVSTILLLIMASLISLKSSTGSTGFSGPTPPYPPRSGEGLVNGFGPIALLLLALVLGAYFGAMLYFVGRAGRSVQRTAYSKQGAAKGGVVKTFETVGGPGETNKQPGGSEFVIRNSSFSFGSLLLLPIVFMTLHFSYGLGSLWGLISLPCWAARKKR